jgi:hypothetical protein
MTPLIMSSKHTDTLGNCSSEPVLGTGERGPSMTETLCALKMPKDGGEGKHATNCISCSSPVSSGEGD